jgi:hypothetical protein
MGSKTLGSQPGSSVDLLSLFFLPFKVYKIAG